PATGPSWPGGAPAAAVRSLRCQVPIRFLSPRVVSGANRNAANGMHWSAAASPNPPNTAVTHLRDVLGDQTYEPLARKGKTMPPAAIVPYSYAEFVQARAEVNA